MSLLWELFQEYQIGQRKTDHQSIEEMVTTHDKEIGELVDIIGEMAKRIDQLEAIVAGAN